MDSDFPRDFNRIRTFKIRGVRSVLDQTRLRSLGIGLRTSNILNVLIRLKSLGKSEGTLYSYDKCLSYLGKHCNLNEPLEVSKFIASLTDKKGSYKANLVKAYYYAQYNSLQWEKPKYHWTQTKPKIPTTETLNNIIEYASKKYKVIFKVLMETGVSPYELSKVTDRDIDTERNTISVQGFKGHASRTLKLKSETVTKLVWYLSKYPLPFPSSHAMCREWRRIRTKASRDNSSVKTIRLYDLRHYYCCMTCHRTRDILFTMQQMGHHQVTTTLFYAQLLGLSEEEYTSAVAKDTEEAQKLTESGFEYVTTFDNIMLFRKRK